MGICWYCYWGWPRPVHEIYTKALEALGDSHALHYGPGHIVWEDENFQSAEWCLEHFEEYAEHLTEDQKVIVRISLEELAQLPLEIRDPEPKDYDEEHPENYPLPADLEMIKR